MKGERGYLWRGGDGVFGARGVARGGASADKSRRLQGENVVRGVGSMEVRTLYGEWVRWGESVVRGVGSMEVRTLYGEWVRWGEREQTQKIRSNCLLDGV